MARLRATPLTPVIGAIVEGVQVAQPLKDEEVEAITNALVKYQVLFFRNQTITPLQQRDFAKRFGDLHIHPIYPNVPEAPQILILDADGEHPPNNEEWHTDVTFIETPPLGSVLSAKLLPPIGGDTMWASGTAAYDALSEPFKRFLQGLQAEHDFAKSFSQPRQWNNSQTREEATAQWEEAKKAHPPILHPVVRTHPVSGKKAIFVNENFTTRIVGVQPRESEALLGFLYAHTTRPEFCVRWRWQEKDVAFWDNRVTQHSALGDYLPHRRIMNRATILGDKPF